MYKYILWLAVASLGCGIAGESNLEITNGTADKLNPAKRVFDASEVHGSLKIPHPGGDHGLSITETFNEDEVTLFDRHRYQLLFGENQFYAFARLVQIQLTLEQGDIEPALQIHLPDGHRTETVPLRLDAGLYVEPVEKRIYTTTALIRGYRTSENKNVFIDVTSAAVLDGSRAFIPQGVKYTIQLRALPAEQLTPSTIVFEDGSGMQPPEKKPFAFSIDRDLKVLFTVDAYVDEVRAKIDASSYSACGEHGVGLAGFPWVAEWDDDERSLRWSYPQRATEELELTFDYGRCIEGADESVVHGDPVQITINDLQATGVSLATLKRLKTVDVRATDKGAPVTLLREF